MVKRSLSVPLAVLGAATLVAGAASPAAGAGTASSPRIEVIATGLDNPRGLTLDGNGAVLVTEAGRGGAGPCAPGGQNEVWCLGPTGAVTRVSHGHQQRIVTGLPSIVSPTGETLGPSDVLVTEAGPLATVGFGGNPALRPPFGPGGQLFAHLIKLSSHGPRPLVDLGAYEAANDPDGAGPDTDPYGLAPARDGGVLAADAGGNDVVRVDRHGRISTLAVFPAIPVPGPGGVVIPMQAVPTTVTRGPDGAYYVGQLTGFPFPVGGAKVWRLVPGKPPTVYATGFTNIIDIAFDQRGRLVVLEIAKNGLLSGDPTGALIRVERDGTRTEIASTGLVTPTSVAIGRDGSFYVSNKGTLAGVGEVLRIQS